MTENLKQIIDRLDQCIKHAHESGNKFDFIDPAYEIIDELESVDGKDDAVELILQLIERSPAIDYGGPGPLGSFLEKYYKNGYEELLIRSIERAPTRYALHLLHRLINDKQHPHHKDFLCVMRSVSLNSVVPQDVSADAKNSISHFDSKSCPVVK